MADSTITEHGPTTEHSPIGRHGPIGRRGLAGRGVAGQDLPELDLAGADWRSGSHGVGDVQIAFVEGFIAMRNGRLPEGPSIVFTPAEWRAFVVDARDGEFDLT